MYSLSLLIAARAQDSSGIGTELSIRTSAEWQGVLELIVFSAVVGLFVGLIRCLVDDRPSVWSWAIPAKTVASAIFVSIVAGLTMWDFDLGLKMKIALTATCAYVANDIIHGMMFISAGIAKDPIGFIRTLRSMIAGSSSEKDKTT